MRASLKLLVFDGVCFVCFVLVRAPPSAFFAGKYDEVDTVRNHEFRVLLVLLSREAIDRIPVFRRCVQVRPPIRVLYFFSTT